MGKNKVKKSVSEENIGAHKLPHERDEKADNRAFKPRPEMKQAYSDLQKGLIDTDLRGERGVEKVVRHLFDK